MMWDNQQHSDRKDYIRGVQHNYGTEDTYFNFNFNLTSISIAEYEVNFE